MAAKPKQEPSFLGDIEKEVSAEASPLLQFLVRHARLIVLVIVFLAVIIAGYGIYKWRAGASMKEARNELGMISITRDPALRYQKLDAFLGAAPAQLRTPILLDQAKAALEMGDRAKAEQAWAALQAENKPETAVLAGRGRAQLLLEDGKKAEALAVLEGLLPQAGEQGRIVLNTQIVLVAESMGDYQRALKACDDVLSIPQMGGSPVLWQQKAADLRRKIAETEKNKAAEKPAGQSGQAAPQTAGQ